MNKVLLIIPAYNEEANIQMVVEELRDHYPELDYVVVNDGSSDRTAQISLFVHENVFSIVVVDELRIHILARAGW